MSIPIPSATNSATNNTNNTERPIFNVVFCYKCHTYFIIKEGETTMDCGHREVIYNAFA